MSTIPTTYRVLFGVFDIVMPLFGIYAGTLDPALILSNFVARPTLPPSPETQVLLDAGAGWHALLVTLSLGFLWLKPDDLTAWRVLQSGVLLVDVFQLGAFYRLFGHVEVGKWTAQEAGNVGGYLAIAAVRTAFLLGIGMRREKHKTK